MRKQMGFASAQGIGALLVLAVSIAGVVGWIWNIVKIINTGFDVFTGMLIARVVGVFLAPLGAVLGYL